jgi:hypothetical protein
MVTIWPYCWDNCTFMGRVMEESTWVMVGYSLWEGICVYEEEPVEGFHGLQRAWVCGGHEQGSRLLNLDPGLSVTQNASVGCLSQAANSACLCAPMP